MLSASTYNQHRGALIIIFNTLKEPAAIIENPWNNTERKNPKNDTISRKPLSDDEIKKLLSYIDRDAIDWRNGIISIRPVKTKQIRRKVTIPIFEPLIRNSFNFSLVIFLQIK